MANLQLSRQQLSQFLPNHEAIKAFEALFSSVNETLPTGLDDVQISADTAQQQAGEALAALAAIAGQLSLALLTPLAEQKPQEEQYLPNKEDFKNEVYAALQEILNPQDLFIPTVVATDGNALLAGSAKQDFNAKQLTLQSLLDISAAAGGQVKFPAAQNASADPNTLDDYEEGTWVPVVTATTPGITPPTFTAVSGTYTKIGNTVFATFDILINANGTGAGLLKCAGLPFNLAKRGFGVGAETDVVGFNILSNGIALTNYTYISKLDGTYPGGNSYHLLGSFTYNV
ncbi:hypothetical protein UFOVP40_37 [uncultured Caudovirales phage]|uniref:Uncharacterized protein n=1 Tax=uncultured Caudovirales phage TaxID=2100421 RepID=A0A6J5KM88_9CAUD|nr:hypothetical protein UFOVP40_37 [uncultured Caudovirales phage]